MPRKAVFTRCNNCYTVWVKDAPLIEENGEVFHGCPNCHTDEYLMDIMKEDIKRDPTILQQKKEV